MSDYVVSARKYRPDSFETLIGQDNIARTLKNSILRGQLAHAYLFCGPRGVGKTTTARIFAKMINCSHPGADMEPCGECESCLSFREGRSYCIHELDAASNNGVDDIKALMDQVQIPPQVGRYSVYIIDEVHMLTSSAFNAFLKTLEEPPAHAIFILATTEKHKIIPTILSRCQTYDFNRISIKDIVRNLRDIATKENVNIDDRSLHIIAQKADGAMRDALTIFDQTVAFCGTDIKYESVVKNLNVLDSEYTFKLVDAFLAGDYATAFVVLDEILAKGFNASYFISALGSHFRDLLVSRTGGLEALLDVPDSLRQTYAEQASKCSVKFIYDALGIISQCESGYRTAVNQRLHIEFALMRLAFLSAAPAVAVPTATAPAVAAPAAEKARPSETSAPAPVAPVAPAPVVPAAPEAPAEKPKRSGTKSGAGLSLKSLLNEGDEDVIEMDSGAAAEDSIPDDDAVKTAWKSLPTLFSGQPRMANMLATAQIELYEAEGDKVVKLTVVSEAQKQFIIERHKHTIEDRLRSGSGSRKLHLEIDVLPEEKVEEKIYMPAEQAKDLMKKNSEVEGLVKDLELDI